MKFRKSNLENLEVLVKPEEKANDDDIKISRNMTREEGGDVGGYEGGRRGCEVSARRNKQQQGEQAPSPTPSSSFEFKKCSKVNPKMR